MGIQGRIEEAERDEELPQRYVAMCVETWAKKFGLAPDVLGGAMLAHAVNLLLEQDEPREVAMLLAGLAVQICPPETAGHA